MRHARLAGRGAGPGRKAVAGAASSRGHTALGGRVSPQTAWLDTSRGPPSANVPVRQDGEPGPGCGYVSAASEWPSQPGVAFPRPHAGGDAARSARTQTQSALTQTQSARTQTRSARTQTQSARTQTQSARTQTQSARTQTRSARTQTRSARTQTRSARTQTQSALTQTQSALTQTQSALTQTRSARTQTQSARTQTRSARTQTQSAPLRRAVFCLQPPVTALAGLSAASAAPSRCPGLRFCRLHPFPSSALHPLRTEVRPPSPLGQGLAGIPYCVWRAMRDRQPCPSFPRSKPRCAAFRRM
jgi:hypothetical protein